MHRPLVARNRSAASSAAVRTVLLSLLFCVPAAVAEETCPCPPPEPPPPLWTGSAGLSYLQTSGNTDTESLGLTLNWKRQPTPWGIEISALANRADSDGERTAERYFAGVRGKRALGDRFELFAGLSWEQNEFAGFDARTILEAGGVWKALLGPTHELAFDLGLTWTSEDPVDGESDDFLGAVAGALYVWKINDRASFRERLAFYPNFDVSDDWRLTSETSLDASIAAAWALRVSYRYERDNLPPPGFEKTDGSTAVSLVWKR
ncbi:MAG: YdiY family protein [Thermoanaerobaculia bacterium]